MIDVRTGEEVILTKKRAIREHRKMWKWIANQYKAGSVEDVEILEEKYLEDKYEDVRLNRFCCEYDEQIGNRSCINCPIKWGTEYIGGVAFCVKEGSPYKRLTRKFYLTPKLAQESAKKIANLPKKRGREKKREKKKRIHELYDKELSAEELSAEDFTLDLKRLQNTLQEEIEELENYLQKYQKH